MQGKLALGVTRVFHYHNGIKPQQKGSFLVPSGVSQNRIQCQTNAFSLFSESVRYTVNTYEIEVFSGFS